MLIHASPNAISGLNLRTYDKIEGAQSLVAKYFYDKEKGNALNEWACDMFYFLGKRGMQIMHAASGLTIFLFNLNYDEQDVIGQQMQSSLSYIFEDCVELRPALKKFISDSPTYVYDKLTDKAMIARLERTKLETAEWLDFHSYIENGILRTRKLNKEYNWVKLSSFGKNSKIKKMNAAQAFMTVLMEKYS